MSPRIFSHEPINFRSMSPVLKGLIGASIAAFLAGLFVGREFSQLFGLVPRRVLEDRWIWQPLTYLFLHGNFMHLLFNLFALWMFGMPVEAQWGGREFLKYYFICGLGAAAAHLILSPHSGAAVIGSSGPVYGLLVAFAMLYPDAVVYLYFMIPLSAKHMAILFGLIEFFAVLTDSSPGVARFAHLGGLVTGYLYIRWWWVVKIKVKGWLRELGPAGMPRRPAGRRSSERGGGTGAGDVTMDEIDRILDKILVSGIESLTEEERQIMRRYSARRGASPPSGEGRA